MNISHLPALLQALFASNDEAHQNYLMTLIKNTNLSKEESDAIKTFFMAALKENTSKKQLFILGLRTLLDNIPSDSSKFVDKLLLDFFSSSNVELQSIANHIFHNATKAEKLAFKVGILDKIQQNTDQKQMNALISLYEKLDQQPSKSQPVVSSSPIQNQQQKPVINSTVSSVQPPVSPVFTFPVTSRTPQIPLQAPQPRPLPVYRKLAPQPMLGSIPQASFSPQTVTPKKRNRKDKEGQNKKKALTPEKNSTGNETSEKPTPQATITLNPNVYVRLKQQLNKVVLIALTKDHSPESLNNKLGEWGYITDTAHLSPEHKQQSKDQHIAFSNILNQFKNDTRPLADKRIDMEKEADSAWQSRNDSLAFFILYVACHYDYLLKGGSCNGEEKHDLIVLKKAICEELKAQCKKTSRPTIEITTNAKTSSTTPIDLSESTSSDESNSPLPTEKKPGSAIRKAIPILEKDTDFSASRKPIPVLEKDTDFIEVESSKPALTNPKDKSPTKEIQPEKTYQKSIRLLAKKLDNSEKATFLTPSPDRKKQDLQNTFQRTRTELNTSNPLGFFDKKLQNKGRGHVHKTRQQAPVLLIRNLPSLKK